jgi:enolase
MPIIEEVRAREVLDSRGNPTVEVELRAAGEWGRAIVPSGASTGSAEAVELRDGDPNWYGGRGVRRAVENVRSVLGPAVRGQDAVDQSRIDRLLLELDGTPRKSKLGANAILGVSLASAVVAARAERVPLYAHLHCLFSAQASLPAPPPRIALPMTNMISGGLHAGGNLDFQDILIEPVGPIEYPVALEWIVRVYKMLGALLREAGFEGRLVGDEGGFGPRLASNRSAVEFVIRAIERAGLVPGEQLAVAIDVAASHFVVDGHYQLHSENDLRLSAEQMIDRLEDWTRSFPVVSIEDGLGEADWNGWQSLTKRLGQHVRLVGDDLFATNPTRIEQGISQGVANSVLIKVNQIGTLTETFQAIDLARAAGYSYVVSARSGESEDDFLADLATATAATRIKIGSIVRSERLAKYNRLLRIAEELES